MLNDRDRDPGIEIAIAEAGGGYKLAKMLQITPAAVSLWKKVPVKHVLTIERELKIPRHELRPDIYPPEPQPEPPRRGRPRKNNI
jgi:DNA-binding transcriptional regulator YdaS (Cro superfamily)